ncbi:hypothetical protein SPYCA_1175 [Sphingopyxis sp. FD7]|nr:hypothetical protein SPYCA_1175 [Sphingopyxis sp. FD7]
MGNAAFPRNPFPDPYADPAVYPRPSAGRDRLPKENLSPHEQDQWGNELPQLDPPWVPGVGYPIVDSPPGVGPDAPPKDEAPPSHEPVVERSWTVVERGLDRFTGRRVRTKRRAAPSGEKERKWKIGDNALYQAVVRVFGAVTEATELASAFVV